VNSESCGLSSRPSQLISEEPTFIAATSQACVWQGFRCQPSR
jgi:hypothetical protein